MEGIMKKIISSILMATICAFCIFAGDVAEYHDLGFSKDGEFFVFAEYGVNDKTFDPYAKIYTVDVKKNEFVKSGVFKSELKDTKEVKGGKAVFDELYAKNKSFIDEHSGYKADLEHTLYLRGPESKNSTEQIIFKDFNNSKEGNEIFYHINLVKNTKGTGKDLKSSFFITVERKNEADEVLSRQIAGNPDFLRSEIADYAIRRIITDESGKYLVFEIEKKIENENGISFRYMVETLVLK